MIKVEYFTFNPLAENTYVLSNEKGEAVIIDPGFYFPEEAETFAQYIEQNKLKPILLLNTHCHLDHVFGNKYVHEKYKLELHIHKGEQPVLDAAPAVSEKYGLPFENYTGPLHFLQEGNTIFLGDDALNILLTPGHSPASICFYAAKQNFIISGDVLFFESIGRYDFPGGNQQVLYQSIINSLYTLPDETIVYSGHGKPTTIGHEKKYNPFVRL